jgi:DNA-binding PadR family transcriptional regulator
MPIPDISHIQYLLLTALMGGQQSGRDLRKLLEQQGHKKSLAAFYQFMARMEDAKLVKGRYEVKVVDDQTIKERVYEITGSGSAACVDVREFYSSLAKAAPRLGLGGA